MTREQQNTQAALDQIITNENNARASERWQDPDVMERIDSLMGRLGARMALVPEVEGDDFDEAELYAA